MSETLVRSFLLLVLADWFADKWEQRRWRGAIMWAIVMSIVLVVMVALTEHFGWAIWPINL